jgi:predicted ATPase
MSQEETPTREASAPSLEIFCVYAQSDVSLLFQELEVHLSLLRRQGLVSLWHERLVAPGTDWKQAIDSHLEQASLILLLVSPAFLASDYCYEVELQRALQRQQAHLARVIPILLRPCEWNQTPLATLQCLPQDGKPMSMRRKRDAAWKSIAEDIRQAVEELPRFVASPPRTVLPSEHSLHKKQNFPAPVSSFIGRKQELSEIRQCLHEHRLITLIGTGGTGKTRLALQAAIADLDRFADGVWLVELAPLEKPELVVETIAKVLALPETPDLAPIERLVTFLQAKHLLLVLDSCEHLIETCARTVASLLVRCPRLALLVTSREPLSIDGEVVLRVPVLSLPEREQPVKLTHFLQYDALHLFIERAHAAEPLFRLTEANAQMVVEICRQLDGLPLALELAAVWVRGMGVSILAQRLDQRFQLLTGGVRTALPRQQTLYATIDWSYSLLSEQEQVVLRRLGIFVGGFSLEAAEGVCTGAYNGKTGQEIITLETILNHLQQLVNKSLVQFNQETSRYRLLETIRFFSLERLAQAGETEFLSRQHFVWSLQLTEHGAPNLSGFKSQSWVVQVEQEHENLRAALSWAIETDKSEEAARLALALWRFWHTHNYLEEGLRWLKRILELDTAIPLPTVLRPQLFNALGVLSHSLLQFDHATSYHAEALRLWQECGDRIGIAQALFDIGWQQFEEMKLDQARVSATESLALAREAEDQPTIAGALLLSGLTAMMVDQVDEAIPALEESLAIWRTLGDTDNMAKAMDILAHAEGKRGNHKRANGFLAEAVRLHIQMGNQRDLIGSLVALCFLAIHTTYQPEGARSAAQVLGAIATWEATVKGTSPWAAAPQALKQIFTDQITARLDAETFAQAFEEGKHMTFADLAQLAEQITALNPLDNFTHLS